MKPSEEEIKQFSQEQLKLIEQTMEDKIDQIDNETKSQKEEFDKCYNEWLQLYSKWRELCSKKRKQVEKEKEAIKQNLRKTKLSRLKYPFYIKKLSQLEKKIDKLVLISINGCDPRISNIDPEFQKLYYEMVSTGGVLERLQLSMESVAKKQRPYKEIVYACSRLINRDKEQSDTDKVKSNDQELSDQEKVELQKKWLEYICSPLVDDKTGKRPNPELANTKWNVKDLSTEEKAELQMKWFEEGYRWLNDDVDVLNLDFDYFFLNDDGVITYHQGEIRCFTKYPFTEKDPKKYLRGPTEEEKPLTTEDSKEEKKPNPELAETKWDVSLFSKDEKIKLQRRWFKEGYIWPRSRKQPSYLDSACYFLHKDGTVTHSQVKGDYFKNHPYTEESLHLYLYALSVDL